MPCVYLVLLVGGWGGFVLREIWRGDWGGGGGGSVLREIWRGGVEGSLNEFWARKGRKTGVIHGIASPFNTVSTQVNQKFKFKSLENLSKHLKFNKRKLFCVNQNCKKDIKHSVNPRFNQNLAGNLEFPA